VAAIAINPLDRAIQLQLHFEGANGSTLIKNGGWGGVLAEKQGTGADPTITTAQSAIGSSCLAVPVSSALRLTYGNGQVTMDQWPSGGALVRPSGDIQFDFRVKFSSIASGTTNFITSNLWANFQVNNGKFQLGGANGTLVSTTTVLANTWYAVRMVMAFNNWRLYVNGVQEAANSALGVGGYTGDGRIVLGNQSTVGFGTIYFDEFRMLYGATDDVGGNYTVATAPFADVGNYGDAQAVRAPDVVNLPVAPVQPLSAPRPRRLANLMRPYGGVIVGTVKEKHSPANTPLSRQVLLIDEAARQVVASTWSDAAGNYTFTELDPAGRYTVIASDYLHNYRAVAADNLQAVLA